MSKIDEAKLESKAERYLKTYKKQVESLEKGLVGRALGGKARMHQVIALGEQLERWSQTLPILEASGTLNSLGELPKLMADVITAVMSNSVLPIICATRPIEAQKAMVKFKVLKSSTTKGNLNNGDTLVDPRTGMKTPKGFSGAAVKGEVVVADAPATTVSYTFSLAGAPIRREFTKIYLAATPAIYCKDVVEGVNVSDTGILLGAGVSGTITYSTGVVSLTFAVAPAQHAVIKADYQTNLEAAPDISAMSYTLDSTLIEARAYALKSVFGMLAQYELKKELGDSYVDSMILDLTKEVNAEVAGDMISEYYAAAPTGGDIVTFDPALPSGFAGTKKMHYQDYLIAQSALDSKFIAAAGRGTTKVMIVGADQANVVKQLEGFQLLSDSMSVGSHIFGTCNGIVYVRVPETSLLPAKEGIALFTGADMLEGAGVYAPYMPIVTKDSIPMGTNPLNTQTVAATMAGVKVMVPQFIQKLDLA